MSKFGIHEVFLIIILIFRPGHHRNSSILNDFLYILNFVSEGLKIFPIFWPIKNWVIRRHVDNIELDTNRFSLFARTNHDLFAYIFMLFYWSYGLIGSSCAIKNTNFVWKHSYANRTSVHVPIYTHLRLTIIPDFTCLVFEWRPPGVLHKVDTYLQRWANVFQFAYL